MAREREFPRVAVESSRGVLRGAVPVRILDLSRGGLNMETHSLVRPGSKCDLSADIDGLRLSARILITRCSALGAVPDGQGGRVLLYRAGASIVEIESGRADELERWLVDRVDAVTSDGPEGEGGAENRGGLRRVV